MLGTIKDGNLPFSKELSRVPRYASTHHETLKRHRLSRKLTADDLSKSQNVFWKFVF
ncbi:hypothetical protein O9992_00160 [Vibrio lentus]|nr:hypothetical protein [Vibrio lentus]